MSFAIVVFCRLGFVNEVMKKMFLRGRCDGAEGLKGWAGRNRPAQTPSKAKLVRPSSSLGWVLLPLLVLLPLGIQFTARRVRHSYVSTSREVNISKGRNGYDYVATCIPVYLA